MHACVDDRHLLTDTQWMLYCNANVYDKVSERSSRSTRPQSGERMDQLHMSIQKWGNRRSSESN
jgi:hypothetical protein